MLKRFFKKNSHSILFKPIGKFGLSLYRFYENRNHDIYSNGELNLLKKIAKTNPEIIFDGGANIGKYSITVRNIIPNAKIFSFEPVEDTFNKLKENTNKISNIFPVNKGLFSENCTKNINIFTSNTHSSLFDIQGINYKPNTASKIELIKGDDFLKDNKIDKIDFLKLDLEGAEYEALLGFENSIKKGIIKAIQFEYGYINISTKKLLIDYYNLLKKYDFLIGKIYPKKVEFRNYNNKHEDFIGPNFLAVHKSNTDLLGLL